MDKRIENFLKVLKEKYDDDSSYVWHQVYSDLLKLRMSPEQKQALLEGYTQVVESFRAAKWDALFTEVTINNKLPDGFYIDSKTLSYPYPSTGVSPTSIAAGGSGGSGATSSSIYDAYSQMKQHEALTSAEHYNQHLLEKQKARVGTL